jgi:hypothetical protein
MILRRTETTELVYTLGYWMKPRQWSFFPPTGAREINNGRLSEDGTINESIMKMPNAACNKKG